MAESFRNTEKRHRAAATIHQTYGHRLATWKHRHTEATPRPVLMETIAAATSADSAILTVHGADHTETLVATSDARSRRAHDLEATFAEGPAHYVRETASTVHATQQECADLWPYYGPAVRELGVDHVLGAALQTPDACLGALVVFDPAPATAHTALITIDTVAQAVLHSVLLAPDAIDDSTIPTLEPFEEQDFQVILHQAAGKIAVRNNVDAKSAISLIHAHAYAENRTATAVAQDIIDDALSLP
jgi:hypothetical protein